MPYLADQGEIVALEIPHYFHKTPIRQFLVLSPKAFNEALGLSWVCPILGDEDAHLFHKALPSQLETFGVVHVEGLAAIKLDRAKFVEHVPDDFLQQCKAIAGRVLGF